MDENFIHAGLNKKIFQGGTTYENSIKWKKHSGYVSGCRSE